MHHVVFDNKDNAEVSYNLDPRLPAYHVTVLYGIDVVVSASNATLPPPPPIEPPPPPPSEPPPIVKRYVVTRELWTLVFEQDRGHGKQIGRLWYSTKVELLETSDHWWGKIIMPNSDARGWLDMNKVSEVK